MENKCSRVLSQEYGSLRGDSQEGGSIVGSQDLKSQTGAGAKIGSTSIDGSLPISMPCSYDLQPYLPCTHLA